LLRAQNVSLPVSLDLAAINEQWAIHYQPSVTTGIRVKADRAICRLTVCAEASFVPSCLKLWLKKKAKKELVELLEHYSRKYNLPYRFVSIRLQSSRWGSCSKNHDINLNAKLLLLPLELTHYVIVHELIHTLHFNHSAAFWDAVAEIVPNHRELRSQLKRIDQSLPNWLY
jgi:predicted metal-dependent hydrolase